MKINFNNKEKSWKNVNLNCNNSKMKKAICKNNLKNL